MGERRRTNGEKEPSSRSPRAPLPSSLVRWRLRVLLVLLVVLLSVAVLRWVFQARSERLPELPEIALNGIDPEVAEVIADARAGVLKSPRSRDAWVKLAMFLDAHLFF